QPSARKLGASLRQLAENDAGARPEPARDERQPPEQDIDQRRLAAAVRTGDREPVGPAELDVERPERERPAPRDRDLQAHHDVAATAARRPRNPQLPRLLRLLRLREPLGPPHEN